MDKRYKNSIDFDYPSKVDMSEPKSKFKIFFRIVLFILAMIYIRKKRPEFFYGIAWVFGIGKKI